MAKDKTQLLLENPEVFQETLNEFSSKSYDLASVNEIIKRSQYNKGSFYYRFKDKFELYISLLDYVFVQQIDLYQKTGFSLITNDDSESILRSMFHNLIELYELDQRYYHLIITFLSEDQSFIDRSLKVSVGSLYQRYLSKLIKLGFFSSEKIVIIDSLYKNFPISGILNQSLELTDMVNALIGQQNNQKVTDSNKTLYELIETSFNDPVNYLLIDQQKYRPDDRLYDLIAHSQDMKANIRKLKLKSFSMRLNTKKVLKRFAHKPIFNYLAVNHLINDGLESIEEDQSLIRLLYGLIVAIVDMKEFIVISQSSEFLDEYQWELLLKYILPINGKLSKIILVEKQLSYSIDYPFSSFYYFDDVSGLKKYHINDFKESYAHKLHCEFMINDNHQRRYFDSLDSLNNFRKNNDIKILTIKFINYLNLDDLRGDVS